MAKAGIQVPATRCAVGEWIVSEAVGTASIRSERTQAVSPAFTARLLSFRDFQATTKLSALLRMTETIFCADAVVYPSNRVGEYRTSCITGLLLLTARVSPLLDIGRSHLAQRV